MSPITFTLSIFLVASIQNIGAFDPYPDAVVSFWRLDAEGKSPATFLGVGAMIKPNCIIVRKKFLRILQPFDTIGFYTGRSYRQSRELENSAVVDAFDIPAHRSLSLLIVKPSIYVETPFRIIHRHYLPGRPVDDDCGDFIGWNIKNGFTKKEVYFQRYHQFHLRRGQEMDITEDNFPPSSFLVKGEDIIAISHTTFEWFSSYSFTKVSCDLTKPLQQLFYFIEELEKADADPFPEAVVSFWRLDENKTPIELLYVGALIESNFILVSRDALNMLTPFDSIGLYTRHKYTADLPTPPKLEYHTIMEIKEISKRSRFIILVMYPSIKLLNPYIVTNSHTSDTFSKIPYHGHFIGWEKTGKAERKEASLIAFQENLHLVFKDNCDSFENFPLGSFLVSENRNIKAIFHSVNEDGEPTFLVLSDNDSVSISTFLERENNPYYKYMNCR